MKKKIVFLTGMGAAFIHPILASATESGTPNSAVVTAMTTVANDMQATANSVIPIALGVVGIALVVVFGIRIFKKIVSK